MIKYECEICRAVVVTEEAIGQDVYLDDVRGKAFQWQASGGEIITITFEQSWIENPEADRPVPPQQFCYGCMFRVVRELLAERFPKAPIGNVYDWSNPAADFTHPASLPEGDLYVEAHRATVDPEEDRQLQELYSQGQLPEPGSNDDTETPVRICTCERRGRDGVIIYQDPSCPVHSPGGSPGPSRGLSD